jgi:hypothetical protein
MRGKHPAGTGDNADLRDLLVAVRARVSGVGDQRRAPLLSDRVKKLAEFFLIE